MFKQQLMDAVKMAMHHYNNGSDDTDAVVKAASACNFNPDQTRRLTESYNTAKTICFFKTAEDRTGVFNTVLATDVLSKMFTPQVLADSRKKQASSEDFYKQGFVPLGEDTDNQQDINILELWGVDTEPAAKTAEEQAEDKLKQAARWEKAAESLSDKAGMLDYTYDKLAYELSHFCRGRTWRDPDIVKQAEAYIVHTASPEMADFMISEMKTYIPDYEKLASGTVRVITMEENYPEFAELIKNAEACLIESASIKAVAQDYKKQAEYLVASVYKEAGMDPEVEAFDDFLTPQLKRAGVVHLAADDKPKRKKTAPSSGGFKPLDTVINSVVGGAGDAVKTELTETAKDAIKNKSSKDLEDARDTNIRRGFILSEILATDPELKQYDPNAVLEKYRYVLDNYPDFTMDRQALPGLLKTLMESQTISPYDAVQLMEYGTAKYKRNKLDKPRTQVQLKV